jgi:hypothetical protein
MKEILHDSFPLGYIQDIFREQRREVAGMSWEREV